MDHDWAVEGATLVTMAGDRLGIVDDGTVAARDGELAYAGLAADYGGDPATRIDGEGLAVLPGLVNAHAHTRHTLLRGGAQDVPEIEWMDRALGPLATAATGADEVAGARLGVLEAVRSGVTTIAEYAGSVGDLVAAVHRPLGVRTVAVETIAEVPDDRADLGPRDLYPFDREKGEAALSRADDLFDRFADDPLVEPAYGPQAVDMVSADRLATVADRAADRDARVHVHVAQGERERRQVEARYGADTSAVDVLADAGLVDGRLVAVHCHGATPAERERLADAGASMVGCPSSIAAIDGVVAPVAQYRDAGGVVGIGTDQAPGPGHHDLLRETRTAALLSKTRETDPTALPAWAALRAVTVDGARALGIDDRVGTLEAGTAADLITVDLRGLDTAPTVSRPLHTAVPNLVYGATGRDVRDVFVAGDPVVRDGEFVDADPRRAVAEATERARDLYDRAEADWRDAGSELVDAVDDGWL
jgi:5-methylthioadenosine/S-adenosylhomocysteine deaminase